MQATVHAFVTTLHCGRIHVGDAGNFFGEEMIPELPDRGVRRAEHAIAAAPQPYSRSMVTTRNMALS